MFNLTTKFFIDKIWTNSAAAFNFLTIILFNFLKTYFFFFFECARGFRRIEFLSLLLYVIYGQY